MPESSAWPPVRGSLNTTPETRQKRPRRNESPQAMPLILCARFFLSNQRHCRWLAAIENTSSSTSEAATTERVTASDASYPLCPLLPFQPATPSLVGCHRKHLQQYARNGHDGTSHRKRCLLSSVPAFHPVTWNLLLVLLPDISQAMQAPAATWMSVMSQSSMNSAIDTHNANLYTKCKTGQGRFHPSSRMFCLLRRGQA